MSLVMRSRYFPIYSYPIYLILLLLRDELFLSAETLEGQSDVETPFWFSFGFFELVPLIEQPHTFTSVHFTGS